MGKTIDWIKFKIIIKKRFEWVCPTRWKVPGDALAVFIDNFTELMDLWDMRQVSPSYTEMKARSQVKTVISTFQFLFSSSLGKITLKQADTLSKTLQILSISATQGQ